jgi:hypothetical protein
MLRKILLLALTSGLAAKLYRDYRRPATPAALPTDKQALHTWEDEGGALPPKTH